MIPLHFHFINFKAAFETVWRKALWKMLSAIGVSSKIVSIIRYMYDNTKCAVTIDNLTEWFTVAAGVHQGCILSTTLFNILLEFVMDDIASLCDLEEELYADVRYAYDTTLIRVIFEKLKLSSQELENACRKWGVMSRKYLRSVA